MGPIEAVVVIVDGQLGTWTVVTEVGSIRSHNVEPVAIQELFLDFLAGRANADSEVERIFAPWIESSKTRLRKRELRGE